MFRCYAVFEVFHISLTSLHKSLCTDDDDDEDYHVDGDGGNVDDNIAAFMIPNLHVSKRCVRSFVRSKHNFLLSFDANAIHKAIVWPTTHQCGTYNSSHFGKRNAI